MYYRKKENDCRAPIFKKYYKSYIAMRFDRTQENARTVIKLSSIHYHGRKRTLLRYVVIQSDKINSVII